MFHKQSGFKWNENIKLSLTMFFEVGQEDKYPGDIPSNTREMLMSDNWDY